MSDEPKSNSRQKPESEPKATHSTVPMWVFSLTLVLLYLGAVYFDHHGGWFNARVYAPYANAEELDSYQPKSGAAELFEHGGKLFDQNCGICHGTDGLGKPGLAPPLAGSEWVMAKGDERLAHIPLEGLNGAIEVKGQQMNFPNGMVAIGQAMSDADLAAVLTYIRGSWGNNASPVSADDVKTVRAAIGASPQPTTAAGLMKMKE